ncbi:MAG: tRNA (N6-isopentenyl adenosine(37)-C2)-methylthiotransferase MiaB [Acidobacteria bacterium RIFCSPLOWO2_12_FULL_67_14]|nr:MAG: tRNA (N6-isopentenyl adenosine(37)-C2)-methylthiotransferase MiaB [Acidobacteria bacterium RIFCSPLOWO2_02_FULL_67_21]OFW36651.1 MAG: tRNA (N6-isopentenyl adenosine(37)-C2)-methylthiotransferase MiaB [Acidobacteria bacterium RIFCSPLOWO2_12_FULL_67_14]
MTGKFLIETFGCQMNVHDSERIAGLLHRAGYEPADDERDADVIVINTCSVREHAEEKLYTRLGELRVLGEETGRRPIVAVAGCVAQQEGAALLRRTNGQLIDVVVGTQRLKMLPMLVEKAASALSASASLAGAERRRAAHAPFPEVDTSPLDDVSFPLGVVRRGDRVRAYVTIIEGCNDHCAFCVVPYTRGHERMRPRADILAEVREAAEAGRREIQLLGQIVNHYQAPDDPACDFAALLVAVHEVAGVERIRFASPHPRHTGPALIEAVRDLPKVCKHMHLPVQSGSTRVLQAMRRRHSREEYLDLVGRIRAAIPDVAISTDMIVGFPGETAADFDQTLSLVEAVQYESMFSFKYSVRPNTLASRRMPDGVSEGEKTARIVALQAVQREIQTRLHERAVGATVDVLIDGVSRRREGEISGRTSGNTIVNFPVPGGETDGERWVGRTVPVVIRRAGPNSLWGETASGA